MAFSIATQSPPPINISSACTITKKPAVDSPESINSSNSKSSRRYSTSAGDNNRASFTCAPHMSIPAPPCAAVDMSSIAPLTPEKQQQRRLLLSSTTCHHSSFCHVKRSGFLLHSHWLHYTSCRCCCWSYGYNEARGRTSVVQDQGSKVIQKAWSFLWWTGTTCWHLYQGHPTRRAQGNVAIQNTTLLLFISFAPRIQQWELGKCVCGTTLSFPACWLTSFSLSSFSLKSNNTNPSNIQDLLSNWQLHSTFIAPIWHATVISKSISTTK